jgi:hypothetical protein
VPEWYDPATGQLHADKVDESNLRAAQIGFAARFDRESLEVETVRYFLDDDWTTDPFSEEQCVPVPLKLIKELGFFLIPANRAWEHMISFDSELFRRVVAQVGGLPADAVREERARLWKPEHPLEPDAKLKSLVEGVNKELAGLFSRKPELLLRLTGTDSDSVLEAITPHFRFADAPPIPSRRQGMGVLSLQSIILLLQLAQHRATQGKSFCLALEEPELHVPPCLRRTTALLPHDQQSWVGLGHVLEARGRFDEADEAYQRTLAINFHNKIAEAAKQGRSRIAQNGRCVRRWVVASGPTH